VIYKLMLRVFDNKLYIITIIRLSRLHATSFMRPSTLGYKLFWLQHIRLTSDASDVPLELQPYRASKISLLLL